MYQQSGRYDQPLDATFKPPRGGLADKYRATKAPSKKHDSVADSDVSFGWIDDFDSGKSRKEDPSKSQKELGKSRHGELSGWNGLEAISRERDYDFEGNSPYDNNVVRAKPPSGNTRGHAGMARKPPPGPPRIRHEKRSESPRLIKEEPAQDKYSNPGDSWRIMALSSPGEDGMGWGTMFGRMQIRWSGREQRKQAMALATLARQNDMDGRGRTQSNMSDNSKSGSLRPYRQRRKRIYTFILASVLLLVLAVAVVIPTVVFTRKDDKSADEVLDSYVIYNFQAKSPDLVFQADMNDPISEIYINTAQEFCSEMENKVTTNFSEQFAGCVVTGLQNGSVIFIFSLIFDDSQTSPTTTQINFIIVGTTNPNETFQLGSFTLTAGSLNLTSTSVSTTADFTDVNCLAPTPVENGNWSYSGSRFSDIAVLTCNTGYEIQGEATITCTKRYQWSSRPNCTEIVCVNYTLPADSSIEPSTPYGITYNTNITVTCNPGFDITGDSVVSCMADGNWSTSPTCDIKSCPNYTIPEHSQISPASPAIVYNSFFVVTCDEGYDISGENNVTCLANGTWSARPSCTATVCRNYTIPDNSSIEPTFISGHRYQTNITVTCKPGYNIVGENIVMCMADGNWSASPTCNIKSCPNYTIPENSRITPLTPEITYGSGYVVMCDEGYESDGDTNVTCGADATWSSNPECQIIKCPMFPNIEDGYINTDNISYPKFNSTVNVTCNVGYSLSSNDTVRCRSNKTWSVNPSCDLVVCERFIQPANSKIDDDKISTGQTYNTVLSISCDTGYNITGNAEVTCMANGSWSATPRCDEIVCVEYIVPENAKIEPHTGSNQTFNTTLKVSCNIGYEITGDSAVICEADGSWSKDPSCEIVVCDDFPTPENGMINPQNTTGLVFNSTVEVSCRGGYLLSGEDTVRCTASRMWSSLPSCEPRDCDVFIFPANSTQQNSNINSDNSTKYEEELSVECVDGYILVGPEAFSCNASGQWPNITCNKVECNQTEINKPFLSIVDVENDVYSMTCDEGYTLKGNDTVVCDQGNWTDIPDCEIVPCGSLIFNGNGTINVTGTNFGDSAFLKCDPGFEGDDQFVCQVNGNWSGNPTCSPVICLPYNLPNGIVPSKVNEPYSFTDVINLSCQDGFDIAGSTRITCLEDKNWSDNTTCEAVECVEALSIENGKIISELTKNLTFGESVKVECNVGFELNGSTEIVCQSNGKLSEKPKCDKVQCSSFLFPENSIEYMFNASLYGSNITLTCMNGYTVNGPLVSTCQANKTWSEIGVCDPISCQTVTLPEDMQTADSISTISGKLFGEKVNIMCVNNTLLTGEEQISCTQFGNWSITSKCVETDCDIDAFNQPDHSKIMEANNTHLHLECVEGYKIVGEEIVICENSHWSSSPNCTIVSCGELEDPANGNINSTGVTYLETATLECIQGFTPKNSETFLCLSTGDWNDTAECELVDCGNPDPPANAENISVADTKYGSREANITCKEGFEIESPVNLTCSETGDWVSVPSCDIVVCLEDPTIENGKIEVGNSISDREYGDTVMIKCDEGYEVDTNSNVKCEANGSWSGLKNCSLVHCGVYNETLANGTVVNRTGSTFNERVVFECDPGFLLVGEDYITCQQNGSWGNPPLCEEITCIDPNITYGIYRKYSGSIYEVECDDGFLLIGSNFIECQTDQSWNEIPTCREVICANYTEELLNGDIVNITGTRYGDTVTFVCDSGFNLNGSQSIVCDENGAWESKPVCEITDCGDPPVPVNGRLLADEPTSFNTTLYAECDTGYFLDGPDETTCNESGNWSVLGVCELQDCGNVTVFGPYKELRYSNGTRYGSVVTIECAENYTLKSEDSAVCTQDWNVTFFCSSTGDVSFDMSEYEFTVGDPGIIICRAEGAENWTNLFLSTSDSILVTINRTEDTYINTTGSASIRITENTVVSTNSATLEVEILSVACTDADIYTCNIGVTLPSGDVDFNFGQATVDVIDTETEVPTLQVSNTTYNTTAVVTCDSLLGMNTTEHPRGSLLLQAKLKSDTEFNTLIPELENTTYEECNQRGFLQYSFLVNDSWDDSEVKCVIDTDNGTLESETVIIAITGVLCDGLPTVVFGSVINASTEDDQIFAVVCDEGYENLGDMNFTCTTLGWSGDPNCTLLDCGQAVEFDNTVIELTNETTTTYNSIVFGFCEDDHNVEQIFDNETYIVCGADGNWNISFTCKPVECDNVTEPTAGRIVFSNGTTVNSVLVVECDEGFNLVGNYSTAVCSSSGFWVRPGDDNDNFFLPTCTVIGELTFNFESNFTAVERNLTATCTLVNTPDWNRIGIFRPTEGEDIGVVAVVDRISDNSTDKETVPGVEILSSSYFNYDEAVLEILITNISCDNDGVYFCGALKGNISEITDDNSLTTDSYVTVTSEPDVPKLNISETSFEPDEQVEISCQGYVGQTSTRDNKAKLDLQIKYSDKDEFEIITTDIAPEVNKTGCLINHTKRTNLTVNSTYNGAVLRCVTDDGSSPLLSNNVTLTVTVACDELPTVEFGSVNNETSEAEKILAVVCDEGYINLGDTNFTCTASGWSGNPNCTLIDCGPPANFDNIVFDLTNETTTTYNSTVSGVCRDGHNVEQIYDNTTYIVCGEDGNWNITFTCKTVECDNITEPTAGSITFSNGTTFKSVLEIACDEGYNLVGNYSTAVCSASGVWIRPETENDESFLPTCTAIGELTFDFESNVTAVQSNLIATCTLLNTPDWNRIGIFKPTGGEDIDFVAVVDRLSDNSTDKETVPGVEILSSSYFNNDEAVLEILISNVTCDNDGVYFCRALKGNISEITDDNSLTTDSYVTVTSEPDVPMLNVSKTSFEPEDVVELSCHGYVGQTSTRDSKAQLDLQIKYSGNDDFEIITLDIAPEVNMGGCLIKHTKHINLTLNATYDGAVLQCVTDDGNSPLVSDNVTLTVTVACDELPTVEFGSVNNETFEAGQILAVVCDEGYLNLGDTNFTCTASGWSGNPNCTLIDCGPPVDFDNTVFDLTNETTTTYNSTVSGVCQEGHNVEQIYDNTTYIACGGDGNWNISFTCKPVECDNITEPTAGSITFSNGTTFKSVLEIACDEGYNLVGNYSTAVCSASGVWIRPETENDESFLPTCTAIGELTFDFESNVTAVQSNLIATCTLLNTPDWNRIGIFKPTGGEDIDFVAVVDRLSDNSTDKETVPGVEILSSSYFNNDEAVLEILISNVTCDNDGVYFCRALKGNISEITDDNSLTTDSYVTVTSEPDVPMLNVSKTSFEPEDVVELSCHGYVGQTSTRDSKAQLDLQIKYSGNDDFEIITSDIAPEVNMGGCLIKHTKHINLTLNATYDGAVLQCVTDDGNSPLVSDNVTLTVTVACDELPTVEFGSVNNETFEAGQILAVVCDEGYLNLGDTNFTCTASGWSGNPNCTLIDCGPPVDFDNTVFDLTNETTTTYNSTVSGVCQEGHNVEQIYDNTTYIACGGDGNWNISFTCKPVECDNITEPTAGSITFSNGTTFKSVLEIACDEGYSLVGNYSKAICSASGVWIRPGTENDEPFLPICSIIGGLTFGFEPNVTMVEGNLTATCNLLNTPDWNRIGIFRPTEAGDISPVAVVDRSSDNSTEEETAPGVAILSSSYFDHDEAVLEIQISNVTCDNDGVYICGALKGNISEITEDNSLTIDTFITVTSESEVPMLNISKTSLEPNEEVEVSCQGYVGQTSTRDSKAQIDLQIKYSGENDFETITSAIAPEVKQVGCMIEHVKRTTITANSTYDGAQLRCITDDSVSMLFSDNVTLAVTDLSGVTFELQAVAEDAEFTVGMSDPSSNVFIDFQSDFCNGFAHQIGQSDLSEQYLDCRVVSLREGSIVINFEIKFRGNSPPSSSYVISTLTETVDDADTVQIGSYPITKSLVEVIGVTASQGSVSVVFTSDKSIFDIGEASVLTINIQGTTTWEMVSISKTRDGIQTSIGNITESFANVQFLSNHLSLSSDSTSNETEANIIIDFEPVACDDDGIYTAEVQMDDGQSVQVDYEITVEYTPRVDFTLPVEMREDRWTLNITCEAVFHSSVNRTLSWLVKRDGDTEFMEFSPEDIVEKPVEFRRSMSLHTNHDCLWKVKEDFDLNTTLADTWNNTQLRCALSYGTSEQVLSEVGTILLVPRDVCADIEAGENVQNPLECTKRVQCNAMTGDWGYVFATGCEEGTCWVGPGDSDCENISITTTTTTTTPVPGTPYISCSDTMRSEKEGNIAFYPCELGNIDKIGTLNISQDDDTIYSGSDEANGLSGVLNIGEGMTISISEDSLNVSIETSCQNEGLYQITINNGTDAELSLALIADPETPELSVPSNIYLNQRTDMTCSGNVGRDKDGNNAANLSFEIRKADSDMFQEVDGAISRLNEENNCTITQVASVSSYFERDFNKSTIRCVAKAEDDTVLSESALYNISLSEPAVSFVEDNVSSFIGKPFSLECNAENVANLTKLELIKEGVSVAVISSDNDQSSEADVEIEDALIEEGSGILKVNFSMSKCSDKGEYICKVITSSGVTFSTKASVYIQRKPELPQLYPSLQIIEGVSPWADFPTQCYGEVGYPQGTISLESNRDGNEFVSIDEAEAVYTVDDEKCSSIGNITYYNTYTIDWDNTELRCVTRNSLVGDEDSDDGDFEISLTKTINVIPASFCDDMEDGPVPHPYYCYGRLTCAGNGPPIPFHLCSGNNTQCFDESQGLCVDCESVNKCDIGSTPAPTLPPGTPIINCTKEVKDTKNSIVTINCELTNINVTLATLNSSNVVLISKTDGNVVLDTATATNVSTSETESVYAEGTVTASIASSMIQIEMNLTECDIAGDYTVRYNGNSVVEDNTNFVVTADAVPPVYSQRPNVFYAGQSATIQCSGNVGGPKESAGNLSLIYKTSESGEWLVHETKTIEEIEDDETCGIIVTKTHELDVTEDLDGYIYACETVTQDNQTYRSDVKLVSVQDQVLLFGEADITAAIGDPLDIACTWDTTIINASATISRSAISSDSEEILLVYEFGEDVTSQRSGINGNFQPGDEGRPNNLSLTFEEISCEDEAIYSCQLLVDDELVAEAKETISVTSKHSTPTMTLPQQLVLNQPTLYSDYLKCNGSVGYPSDHSILKLEYYSEDGQNVMEFDMGTLVENRTETDDCMTEGELSYRTITFDSGWNGTIFRCALYDRDDILDTSDNQTLLLFENNCDAENDGQYFQHPYDCHLHTRCYNSGAIAVGSCAPNCPNFRNNNTLVTCDNACDDLDCPTT